jgi:hypothetical protein
MLTRSNSLSGNGSSPVSVLSIETQGSVSMVDDVTNEQPSLDSVATLVESPPVQRFDGRPDFSTHSCPVEPPCGLSVS